ncbi:hypothetical protein F8N00_13175 [Exiguobacterium sp. A1_3_1]|uniref:hypothetical protein n=1 Tax=Exiguobacterium sp. A1_3_1 TaxID=2651871 RepID=UPI003B885884
MTMLKTNLEVLYRKNPNLENLYPFKKTFEKLNSFIVSEILNGKIFLNPYRFSNIFEMELSKVFVLFIYISSISDNRILELKYRYTCINNTDVYLTEDELDDYVCDEDCGCGEEFNLREAIESEAVDVPIFFELDSHLISNILSLHKDETSFFERIEGGMNFVESIKTMEFSEEEINLLSNDTDKNEMICEMISQLDFLKEKAKRSKLF